MRSVKTTPTPLLRKLRLRCLELENDPTVRALSRTIHRELQRRANGGKVRPHYNPRQARLVSKLLNEPVREIYRILRR